MTRRRKNILKRKRKRYRQRGKGYAANCWRHRKEIGKGGGQYIYQLWGL